RTGHAARVHLVVGTDWPERDQLADNLRDSFRARAALGRLTADTAMLMWRSASTGVSTPRNYPGRGTGIGSSGKQGSESRAAPTSGVEIQAYQCPDPARVDDADDEALLLRALRPAHARHERLLLLPPGDELDEPAPVGYADVAQALWVGASERPDLDPLVSGVHDLAGEPGWQREPEP